MKRKFATNLILLLSLNLLVKPFWIFGIDRTVQNLVGAGEYGLFYSLFNFSLLLNIVLDFGLTNFNNREISRHSQLISKYFSNIVVIKVILAITYGILCLGVGVVMGYSGRQFYLLFLLIFNQFISSFILYLRSNLSGLQFFKTDSFISVLDRFLMILICSCLLWGNISNFQFSIEWFVYAQTASYIVTMCVAFLLVLPKTTFFKIRFDKVFLISILRQSFPFALLALLMNLYSRIDSVMLERILPKGNVESGIYAQAFRIVDAVNMVPFLFAGLLLPIFSKMIKNIEPTQPLVGFSFSLLFIPAFAFTISCIVFRSELMHLLYHQHTAESSSVLGVLMISFLLISVNYIFGTLLTANGSIWQLNKIALVGVVISFILNIALIPHYKSFGAAIANLNTQLIVLVLQVFLAFKIFNFNVNIKQFGIYFIFIPASIALVFLAKTTFPLWIVGFVFSLLSVALLSFLLKIIKIKELIDLFIKG
ncbi:MAG: oligosaccharide flippase family protein [Bacteroidales bacterium]|nr:oligosaccharide flippase family protein [Bacteroidales bacterium]